MKKYIKEYYEIYNEFYKVNKYREMKSIIHHGNNRLDHISRVSKMSFFVSKKLHLDYISCTRGAMMHDFFVKEDVNKKEYNKYLKNHPLIAYNNSIDYFNVNDVEENVIKTHMFPLTHVVPYYPESKVVCLCDKIVSIYEFFRYEVKLTTNLFIIFVINLINN